MFCFCRTSLSFPFSRACCCLAQFSLCRVVYFLPYRFFFFFFVFSFFSLSIVGSAGLPPILFNLCTLDQISARVAGQSDQTIARTVARARAPVCHPQVDSQVVSVARPADLPHDQLAELRPIEPYVNIAVVVALLPTKHKDTPVLQVFTYLDFVYYCFLGWKLSIFNFFLFFLKLSLYSFSFSLYILPT